VKCREARRETTHQCHRREDENYRVEGEALQEFLNLGIEDLEQATRDNTLAQGDPSHRQEDNSPGKMLEIILFSVVSALLRVTIDKEWHGHLPFSALLSKRRLRLE
jgi:hypothetical protein